LVIAQRLGRRLCGSCKRPLICPNPACWKWALPKLTLATGFTIFEPVGCDQCRDGYKGRVGVYEVMKVTPKIARIIMEEGNSIAIADQAHKEGYPNLRRSGLVKVMQGVTSLQEINRITANNGLSF
jgi:type IV pilus assembly protein PilB